MRWDSESGFKDKLIEQSGISKTNSKKDWLDLTEDTKQKLIDTYYFKGHKITIKMMDEIATTVKNRM